jgi:hypothetical protein
MVPLILQRSPPLFPLLRQLKNLVENQTFTANF